MSLRKLLISAAAAVCAVSLLIPAAFAHGGCHGRARTAQPCAVENCTAAGWHYHNRALYCGHTHGNGLCDGSCALLCDMEGCELTGRHDHDGVTYCGTHHADGICTAGCYHQGSGQWVPACTVEGCTLTGRHVHDGETYCGAHHAGGFCTTDCYGAHTSGGHRGHC